MNKKNKELLEEVQLLEKKREKMKKDLNDKLSKIVGDIMEYRPIFKHVNSSDKSMEYTINIGNNKKIFTRVSCMGHSITAVLEKYNVEKDRWLMAALFEVFFDENSAKTYEYEVRREGKGSYEDVVMLAEETLNNISKPNGIAEIILNQTIENLKDLTKYICDNDKVGIISLQKNKKG